MEWYNSCELSAVILCQGASCESRQPLASPQGQPGGRPGPDPPARALQLAAIPAASAGRRIADLSQLAATTGAVAEHSLEGAMLSNNRPAIQNIVDSVAQAPDVQSVLSARTRRPIVAASPGGEFNGQQLDRGQRGLPGLPPVSAGGPAAQHRGDGGRRRAGIPHHDPHRQPAGLRRLPLRPGPPERRPVR